jgi:hypothetical protein
MNRIDRAPARHLLRTLTAALILTLAIGAPVAAPAPVQAAGGTYYVATWGSDSNSGRNGSPWRTLQKAANAVPAGATVVIRRGTYAGFVMTRSGTSSAPIIFRSQRGEQVVLDGNSNTLNVVRISRAHDIVIRGLVIKDARADKSGAGIRVDQGSYRITIAGNVLRHNRSYGVSIVDSTHVTVRDNDIRYNAEGVFILRDGQGVAVVGNRIHHQNKMVVATEGGHDDHGGVGVSLVYTTGRVLVAGNRVWANRAPSPDWGYDGGAFEIYGASNARIEKNRIWNNRMVIETGSSGPACQDNQFVRNIAFGATTRDVSKGLVLRCAEDMLIANNTFDRLDQFVFDLKNGGTNHSTSLRGLRILNNIAVMRQGKIYGIESAMPSSVVVNYNLVRHLNDGVIGSVVGKGSTSSLSTFRRWTGFESHGMDANPRFVNASERNYHLRSLSRAVDAGYFIASVTSGLTGAAPDIGRFERR